MGKFKPFMSMEQVSWNLLINVIMNIQRNYCKQNIPACTNFIECMYTYMYIHLKCLHEDIRESHALRNVRLKVTKEGSNYSFLLRNLRQIVAIPWSCGKTSIVCRTDTSSRFTLDFHCEKQFSTMFRKGE